MNAANLQPIALVLSDDTALSQSVATLQPTRRKLSDSSLRKARLKAQHAPTERGLIRLKRNQGASLAHVAIEVAQPRGGLGVLEIRHAMLWK